MNTRNSEDQYLQIKKRCRLEEKMKGSRFIGTAAPIESEDEAHGFIDEMKKEFHDATHNCWAWKIGIGKGLKYRYNDDGEPSGTAGQSILKAIDSTRISNVCVVITRYFGGVKLGKGGLMRAYGQTAHTVLKSGEPSRRYATESLAFTVDFDFVSLVHLIIESFDAELVDTHYEDKVTFMVNIRVSKTSDFKGKLTEATNGRIRFK